MAGLTRHQGVWDTGWYAHPRCCPVSIKKGLQPWYLLRKQLSKTERMAAVM
jgi:hypothetical protein